MINMCFLVAIVFCSSCCPVCHFDQREKSSFNSFYPVKEAFCHCSFD